MLGGSGGLGRESCGAGGLLASGTRVAAERGDELVTGGRLWGGNAALIEPSLQVGFRPRGVEPVAGVVDGFTSLVRDGLEVGASGEEK